MALEIQRSVSDLRGLPIKRRLKVGVYDPAALRKFVLTELTRGDGGKRLAHTGAALSLLGMAAPNWRMREGVIELLQEQVGGLYDPRTRELRLKRAMITAGPVNPLRKLLLGDPQDEARIVMAHEITHALQDQHYRLGKMARDRPHNTDLEVAIAGLIEGDATVAMMAWFMQRQGRGGASEIFAAGDAMATVFKLTMKVARVGLLPDTAALSRSPRWLQDRLTSPYVDGMGLCLRAGSWRAIDQLYKHPPLSTEQVLHPRKTLSKHRDDPITITTPDLSAILGKGWHRVWFDTLGELGARSLFGVAEPDAIGERRAAGWGGDRWDLYSKGDRKALVWYASWDTEADAQDALAGLVVWAAKGPQSGPFARHVLPIARRPKPLDTAVTVGLGPAKYAAVQALLTRKTAKRALTKLPR